MSKLLKFVFIVLWKSEEKREGFVSTVSHVQGVKDGVLLLGLFLTFPKQCSDITSGQG